MSYRYRHADPLANALREGAEALRPARREVPVPTREQLQMLQMAHEVRQRQEAAAALPSRHANMMEELRRISAIANAAGIPISIAIMALVENPQEREDYLRILGSLLTAMNAPVLVEQGRQAIQHNANPATPAPSGTEALARALPMLAMLASS